MSGSVLKPLHDIVELQIAAGKGGDGIVSFRREAFVPRGGPDGGDGGAGGDVILIGDHQVNTLIDLYRLKTLKAQVGEPGKGKKMTGKNGQDLMVKIPIGCEVFEKIGNDWKLVADVTKDDQQLMVAKGGRGGWGNWHFATSTRQTPRFAKSGEIGEQKAIKIVLKLLADVGLIGLPNVGKSTLLSRITAAKPRIADYPFTTIAPNLGVAKHKGKSFVVADIPGLIEGAAQGKGLGHQFLQHIERTKILVHLLDAASNDLKKDYQVVRHELGQYSSKLLTKPEIIVLNKVDSYPNAKFPKALKISAYTGSGINKLLDRLIGEI